MERTSNSHLRLYAFFLEALSFSGIFPFQLTYNSKTKILETIDYYKKGKYAWMNYFAIVEYFAFSVLCLLSVPTCILSANPKLSSTNNILAVSMLSLSNFAILSGVFHFNFQKRRLCAMLNDLLRIRRELVASEWI
jgi:hypothetical protein